MIFCPTCANLLVTSKDTGNLIWTCQACPYIFPIEKTVTERTHLPRKQVDDVMGGKDAWSNVDQTDVDCPKCSNGKAYWMQLQIRSADEPSTTFYKCVECNHQWREN